jgi:sugar (pentulose or hexulose) kinase
VLDLPLERTDSSAAGAAFGAALLGRTFADAPAAVAACVRPTARVDPDPALVRAYAEQRPGFAALYPLLHALRQ